MKKRYSKLLFDLDNTLVDDYENRKYAIEKILIDRKEKVTNEKIERFINFDNQFWKDRSEGKVKDPYNFATKEEKTEWVRAYRFIKYFQDITLEEAKEINKKYIINLKENVVPIQNAKKVLEYLYKKKYEIYIVTNSPTIVVMDKLNKIEAQEYVKYAFSAEEAGHMKPHDEFFKTFFDKINSYDTQDMLIIGDELEKDILGGIRNGIDTCWFNPGKIHNNQYKTNYEISELVQLKDIL